MDEPDIPMLARRWVPGTDEPAISPLASGAVNRSFRVHRDGDDYVLRVTAGQGRGGLASLLDRGWEMRVIAAAAARGIAPPLVTGDAGAGVLVTRWVEGRTWTGEECLEPAATERIARLLREVQSLRVAPPLREISLQAWWDAYRRQLSARPLPASVLTRLSALDAVAQPLLDACARYPAAVCLCHSDLHRSNLLDTGRDLVLLDWEYAHLGDPLWDLAHWSRSVGLDPAGSEALLRACLRRAPTPGELSHLRLLLPFHDALGELWALLVRGAGDGQN